MVISFFLTQLEFYYIIYLNILKFLTKLKLQVLLITPKEINHFSSTSNNNYWQIISKISNKWQMCSQTSKFQLNMLQTSNLQNIIHLTQRHHCNFVSNIRYFLYIVVNSWCHLSRTHSFLVESVEIIYLQKYLQKIKSFKIYSYIV